jgi:hypothetical protein
MLPLCRNGRLVKDGLYRTLENARLTIDAVFRVDVEHLLPFVKTIAWADRDTIGVLAADARLRNDECHGSSPDLGE